MKIYVDWPPPQIIATASQKMNLISLPVTLLLSKIAKYTVALQEEKLYVSPGISYRTLSIWYVKYSKNSTEKEQKCSQISNMSVKNAETKILAFKVPIFRGDTLDSNGYIRMVNTNFWSDVMSQFLEDIRKCDNSPYWSRAFASRLRESIAKSDVLSFLAMELDCENNCDNM